MTHDVYNALKPKNTTRDRHEYLFKAQAFTHFSAEVYFNRTLTSWVGLNSIECIQHYAINQRRT